MSYKKVGGLHFLSVGRIGTSFCVKRDTPAFWSFTRLCIAAPFIGAACAELLGHI